ncbi:4-oxalocrotonate tautomerase [Microbacterium sp. Root166]|uniref:tautomerase family protein n=1 Tax=Microbacterium sp. Root166 TaxID=1736478 RepID=UPI0006FCC734|nr:tautomerase family protein [Microbacterium sp. Root166]KQZ84964.1 4-oxalocrotonate tautomerase [Microbacterium sp. Root166]
MPNIRVELLAGRTIEQRRQFAESVTDAAVGALGARREDVRILFEEISADRVANGGTLASEDESRAGVVSRFGADGS